MSYLSKAAQELINELTDDLWAQSDGTVYSHERARALVTGRVEKFFLAATPEANLTGLRAKLEAKVKELRESARVAI